MAPTLLSAGHCSVCIPETPIVFLTGVTNGRVFAFCARCTVAWADPIDEHGWFLEIEGTVPESVMKEEAFFVPAKAPTRPSRGRGKGRRAR